MEGDLGGGGLMANTHAFSPEALGLIHSTPKILPEVAILLLLDYFDISELIRQ